METSAKPRFHPAEYALLQACLNSGADARDAFAAWRELYDLETEHDEAQHRLLPQLHENMKHAGLDHWLMPRLQAIRRLSWGAGQQRNRTATDIFSGLGDKGVPVMVTKGMALGQGYYGDIGLRPMSDIDVLIHPEHVDAALEVFQTQGWKFGGRLEKPGRARRCYVLRSQGAELRKDGHVSIDVHWQPFHESGHRRMRDSFWEMAEPTSIGGVEVLRPSPSHLLFHVVVHGLRPNRFSPVRWVVDAAMILRNRGDDVDWAALSQLATRSDTTQRLRDGLALVHAFAPFDLDNLNRLPKPSLTERMELKGFEEIEEEGDYSLSAEMRKLRWVRLMRLAKSDKLRHLPLLFLDIAERRLLKR